MTELEEALLALDSAHRTIDYLDGPPEADLEAEALLEKLELGL